MHSNRAQGSCHTDSMAIRSNGRVILALIYLVALFGGAGWIYARMQRFEGELCLYVGQAEVLSARPARGSLDLAATYRGLPAEVLPWRNPDTARRFFGTGARFDAAPLPGALRLAQVEILDSPPPRDVLQIDDNGAHQEIPVVEGGACPWEGTTLTMKGLRPWTGLVRDPRGTPMAAIALKPDNADWSAPLLLQNGTWSLSGQTLAIRFDRGEDSPPDHWPGDLSPETDARWGVRDGKAVQWSEGLHPGSGFTLRDGSEVEFVRFDAARAAILLAHAHGAAPEPVWVPVNEITQQATYFFECPALCRTVIRLWGLGEGRVRAAMRESGQTDWQFQTLEAGQSWSPPQVPYRLRLDQAIDHAVPVPQTDPPVWALVLETPDGPLALREGELITWHDRRLRFRRIPVPPVIRAHLEAHEPDGGRTEAFTLTAGESYRWRDWRFAVRPNPAEGQHSVIVEAHRTWGTLSRAFGLLLFAIGAFGLVLVRFLPWSRTVAPDPSVLPAQDNLQD